MCSIESEGAPSLLAFRHTSAPLPKPKIRESPDAQDELISFQATGFLPGWNMFLVKLFSSSARVSFFGVVYEDMKLDIEVSRLVFVVVPLWTFCFTF